MIGSAKADIIAHVKVTEKDQIMREIGVQLNAVGFMLI